MSASAHDAERARAEDARCGEVIRWHCRRRVASRRYHVDRAIDGLHETAGLDCGGRRAGSGGDPLPCGGSTPPPSTSDPGGRRRAHLRQRTARLDSVGGRRRRSSRPFATRRTLTAHRVELADVSCGGSERRVCLQQPDAARCRAGGHSIELVSFVVDNGTVDRERPLGRAARDGDRARPPMRRRHWPAPLSTRLADHDRRRRAAADVARRATRRADRVRQRARWARLRCRARWPRPHPARRRARSASPRSSIRRSADDRQRPKAGCSRSRSTRSSSARTSLYAVYTVAGPRGDRVSFASSASAKSTAGSASASCFSTVSRPRQSPRPRSVSDLTAASMSRSTPPAAAAARAALASYSGKVLRLNTDGTTPQDQPAGPRVRDRLSVAARTRLASLDRRAVGRRRKRRDARGTARSWTPRLAATSSRARLPLPAGTGAAALAFYRGTLLPAFAGDLFVAAEEGRHLLRLRLDRRDPARIVRPSACCRIRQSHPRRRRHQRRHHLRGDRPGGAAAGAALEMAASVFSSRRPSRSHQSTAATN